MSRADQEQGKFVRWVKVVIALIIVLLLAGGLLSLHNPFEV